MSVVMPGKFANRALRPIKRQLSVFEKSTIQRPEGRALVMPAEPNTEIEELVEAGFNPCFIYGVEQDMSRYIALLAHYHDQAHIHQGDVFQFMNKARGIKRYTYVHIDLCGMFTREVAIKTQSWRPLMAPWSRLRFSAYRARQSPGQQEFEQQLHEDLLLRWCEIGYELDAADPERWIHYHQRAQEHLSDTSRLIVAIAVANFFFGIDDYRSYIDDCARKGTAFLPLVEGDYLPHNIKRWHYNEPGTPNHMFTVWMDLQPLDGDRLNNSTQWILNQLALVFEQLEHETAPVDVNHISNKELS